MKKLHLIYVCVCVSECVRSRSMIQLSLRLIHNAHGAVILSGSISLKSNISLSLRTQTLHPAATIGLCGCVCESKASCAIVMYGHCFAQDNNCIARFTRNTKVMKLFTQITATSAMQQRHLFLFEARLATQLALGIVRHLIASAHWPQHAWTFVYAHAHRVSIFIDCTLLIRPALDHVTRIDSCSREAIVSR